MLESVGLKQDVKTFGDFDEIVGQSAVMRAALERLLQVAPLNCSVLLLGETGAGKELFARALHDRSRRRAGALVRVNCVALPPTLIETELFGHEKGAFTGAVGLRQGRFEIAHGGTIFSMKSATSRTTCKASCCACCRKVSSNGSGRRGAGAWTFA